MPIVAIANQKGGSGKTTTAVNLIPRLNTKRIVELDIHHGISNVNMMREEPFEILAPKSISDLTSILENDNEHEFTIIDCGGYDSELVRFAILNSDFVVVPSNDDLTEQFALMKFNETLSEISKAGNKKVIGHVLLNRVYHSRSSFVDIVNLIGKQQNLQLFPLSLRIPQSTPVSAGMFDGRGVRTGNVAAKYSMIADYIKGKTTS